MFPSHSTRSSVRKLCNQVDHFGKTIKWQFEARCLPVCHSLCLPIVCLCVSLSVYPSSACVSVTLSACVSVTLPVYLYITLSACVPYRLHVSYSVCLSPCLPVCQSLCLPIICLCVSHFSCLCVICSFCLCVSHSVCTVLQYEKEKSSSWCCCKITRVGGRAREGSSARPSCFSAHLGLGH
jgi:hypothetical protein